MANLHKVLENSVGKAGDKDLAAHLKQVFGFLVLNYPGQALEKFEEVSLLLKQGKDLPKYLRVDDARDYSKVAEDQAAYIAEMQKRFAGPQPDEEGGEVPEVAPVGFVQDLRADSRQWQWAGVGFGEQETYRLQMSLKKLAADSGATMVRFFGKITGTQADYYVAETQVEAEEEGEAEERDADFEPKGTGVNVYTYFVARDSMSEWTRLPDISPQQVLAARQIRVLFSGDLERFIYTNPHFKFRQEKFYLRAQIARITQSTVLIPKGVQRTVEDNDRETEDNADDDGNIKIPSTLEMARAENWVHKNLNILKNCRTAHADPEEPEGAEDWDAEAEKKKIEEADPYEPRLKPISQDAQLQLTKSAKQPSWVVRLCGDPAEYGHPAKPGAALCNGVVVVRSLQWPGAFSFFHNEAWHQVYLGSGHKFEQASFFPVEPPSVWEDVDELPLGPEPTPLTEPEPAAEAKEEGEEAPEEDE